MVKDNTAKASFFDCVDPLAVDTFDAEPGNGRLSKKEEISYLIQAGIDPHLLNEQDRAAVVEYLLLHPDRLKNFTPEILREEGGLARLLEGFEKPCGCDVDDDGDDDDDGPDDDCPEASAKHRKHKILAKPPELPPVPVAPVSEIVFDGDFDAAPRPGKLMAAIIALPVIGAVAGKIYYDGEAREAGRPDKTPTPEGPSDDKTSDSSAPLRMPENWVDRVTAEGESDARAIHTA